MIMDNTVCRFAECCNNRSIPANMSSKITSIYCWNIKYCNDFLHFISEFENDLRKNLFGQHIVLDKVVKALTTHIKHLDTSRKPLVMSFHGTPGVGKNYVANFIAKALFEKGLDSKFVHQYSGKLDFPEKSKSNDYSIALKFDIFRGIRHCPHSLFIFDEVDDMPSGVFDTITSLLDHHEKVHGLDFRKAIFIFLCNNGGVEIANKLHDYYTKDKFRRQDLQMHHFERALEMSVYNREGGLKKSKPIESGLIDHYIPFLPLEKEHVIGCIEAELKRLNRPMTDEIKKYVNNEIMHYSLMLQKKLCFVIFSSIFKLTFLSWGIHVY